MMASRATRQKNQLPPCYFEGFLEKRSFKDKTSRKLWTCLCGNTLFFFNDKKDADYVEKLDLTEFISITDDNSPDRSLDAARINLQMKDENIKFTAPSAEARELWKGFIHSVTELSVPSSLNLLPGQVHMLKEAVENEKERMRSSSPYISPLADMPACYHNVSRLEAELLLEREAKRGNMLLRPGKGGNYFSITTREDLNGSVFRHYRVNRKHDGGFVILVDNPIHCITLHHVINILVEKTEGALIPLNLEEHYDRHISFIRADNENGEKSVQKAVTGLPPVAPPKPVVPIIPIMESTSVSFEEEPTYMNESLEEEETKTEDFLVVPLPKPNKNNRRKAMMPPTPTPRKLIASTTTSSSGSSTSSPDLRTRTCSENLGQIPRATLSELKLKFEQKARNNE
ncbi:signal-transducing adaptor protein 1-like [Antennarius striatus]|uniref:signal-transducing adaptor protein 1-like n=1 Tax=Antennarius striatus TaxID=241820 RepID=UPI0035AFBEED